MGSATCRPLIICDEIDLERMSFHSRPGDGGPSEVPTIEHTLSKNTKLSKLEVESYYKSKLIENLQDVHVKLN